MHPIVLATTASLILIVSARGFANEPQPWQRHVIDDSSRGADGVRLADFDHDGRLDVVTGWEEGGVVRIYLQPSGSEVTSRWPAVTVGRVRSVEDAVAVDLDGDGALDIVSCCEGQTQSLFVHWAPPRPDQLLDPTRWTTEALPDSVRLQTWMFCLPMQVDGRNGVDLVVGSKNQGAAVGWWESPADPRNLKAWRYHRWSDAGWIMSLLARDIDHDGDVDVIYSDRKGPTRGVHWLENPGAGDHDVPIPAQLKWQRHIIGATDKQVMFLGIGDLDQDGTDDILATTWDGMMELFSRPATVTGGWDRLQIPIAFGLQRGKSIAIADFDRDSQIDLITTNRSQPLDGPAIALMKYQGNPAGGDWKVVDVGGPDGSKFDLIEPLDIDADGDLDVITCEEVANLGVVWYENPTF